MSSLSQVCNFGSKGGSFNGCGMPNAFGCVVLAVTAVGLHYSYSTSYVMAARKKYKIDYPDMGCGRYSARLDKEQWVDFNNAQRVHYNYLEQLPSVYTFILLAGAVRPRACLALTATYILGRHLFCHYYVKYGPDSRKPGSAVMHMSFFGLVGVSIYNGLEMAGLLTCKK